MRDRINARNKKEYRGATPVNSKELLVEILTFCLMPNHYHLIVRQVSENGIPLFMKKLGDSYVGYFNQKHDRKGMGSLFQGRFKAVHVKTTEQLIYLAWYVFTNPVGLLEKERKEEGVKNPQEIIKYLESYLWSGYLDYIGISNFPSVTKRDFLSQLFGGREGIKKFIEDRILDKAEVRKSFEKNKGLTLE